MPHGWASAEVHLLLRDCLVYEDRGALVLFVGIPEAWFRHPGGMEIKDLPTPFGTLAVSWKGTDTGAIVRLGGEADPPGGLVLAVPGSLRPKVTVNGAPVARNAEGFRLTPETREVHIQFGPQEGGTP